MVPLHGVGCCCCPASKTLVDADFTVCVCVCICMYVYVSVCIACVYVYVLDLYLCFICMYGLDFQSTRHHFTKKHPGAAGPAGLDSVHQWACAHINLQVFRDHDPDQFWCTCTQNTRWGGSKHISFAMNTHGVGK